MLVGLAILYINYIIMPRPLHCYIFVYIVYYTKLSILYTGLGHAGTVPE